MKNYFLHRVSDIYRGDSSLICSNARPRKRKDWSLLIQLTRNIWFMQWELFNKLFARLQSKHLYNQGMSSLLNANLQQLEDCSWEKWELFKKLFTQSSFRHLYSELESCLFQMKAHKHWKIDSCFEISVISKPTSQEDCCYV